MWVTSSANVFKIQKLFYRPRNKLYSNLDFPKWNESELAELKAEHRESDDILNEHQRDAQTGISQIFIKHHFIYSFYQHTLPIDTKFALRFDHLVFSTVKYSNKRLLNTGVKQTFVAIFNITSTRAD